VDEHLKWGYSEISQDQNEPEIKADITFGTGACFEKISDLFSVKERCAATES
jgi:hypothetical protein